ncbi:MAG: ABC transporter permease [Candidatus ainarchaeum sp.]|nr:ABC transporter permease [Candidatus ainarchaeum sp.]
MAETLGGLEGIYAIWLREIKVYTREKERIVSSLVNPLLWIFAFGTGLGANVVIPNVPVNYQHYIFPGIMVMAVLFTSVFYGMYVIWDRKLDFLKEVLVAPLSRTNVLLGKMLGGVTDSMIQACVLFAVAYLLGIPLTPYSLAVSLLTMFLIGVCMTSLGLAFGGFLSTIESFQLVINFVVWPVFFFSGALFPLTGLPPWLQLVTYADPLTYAVDAMRGAMFGLNVFPIWLDLAAIALFCIPAIALGSFAFSRMGKI